MESQIDMVLDKETKNYWKYREVNGGINTLYLKKNEGQTAPPSVSLVVQVNKA